MRMPRVRFTIGRLMIVVAVAGIFSAWLRVPDAGALMLAAVLILTPPSIGLLYPFLFAKHGRRLLAATWVAALWPLTIPWSLHAAWAVAYVYLGRAPGPGDNGFVIDFAPRCVGIFALLSLFSSAIVLIALLCALIDRWTTGKSIWTSGGTLAVVAILAWGSVFGVLGLNPFNAANWFID